MGLAPEGGQAKKKRHTLKGFFPRRIRNIFKGPDKKKTSPSQMGIFSLFETGLRGCQANYLESNKIFLISNCGMILAI